MYIIPENSSRESGYELIFARLENDIIEIKNKNPEARIVIVGDFNARTGVWPDYINSDENKHVDFPDSYTPDQCSERSSKDPKSGLNKIGRELLKFCIKTTCRILNGRSGKDKGRGEETYMSTIGNSVIDYVLVEEQYMHEVTNFEVRDHTNISDHSPLYFEIERESIAKIPHSPEEKRRKLKWDKNKKEEVKAAISNIGPELDRLLNTINDVNNLTTAFSNTIFEASYGVIGKEVITGGSGTRSFMRNNIKWQCDE